MIYWVAFGLAVALFALAIYARHRVLQDDKNISRMIAGLHCLNGHKPSLREIQLHAEAADAASKRRRT